MTPAAVDAKPLGLTISLVCYRSDPTLLKQTLCSLQRAVAHTHQHKAVNVALVLIDNGQQSVQLASVLANSGWQDNSTIIANPSNNGFARANNQAINAAQSDFHLVLNPDVELAETSLMYAIDYLQRNELVAAVSPACQNSSGQVEYLCKRFPTVFALLLRGFAPGKVKNMFDKRLAHYEYQALVHSGQAFTAQLISGCFMFCRTKALQVVGGFDERYFLYFEDFDLSLRLASQGELHHLPACRITHHGGGAARKGWLHIRLFVVSACRFFNCHGWRWW